MKPQYAGSVLDVGDAEEVDGLVGQVGEVDLPQLVPEEVDGQEHPEAEHRGRREHPDAEDEDADEYDAVEPRGGVDVVLGAAPRGGEPGLERRVGPPRGVHLDVRRAAAQQRVGRGEEHGEGQVEPHRRGERRQDHRAADGGEAPRRFPPVGWVPSVSGRSGDEARFFVAAAARARETRRDRDSGG